MPPSPKEVDSDTQHGLSAYPPCFFSSQEEKKLYTRLREVYKENAHSWDDESRNAWPFIVEHASLPPSSVGKITNHSITRNMMNSQVTWAHFVALRVIYKTKIYKSRKTMKKLKEKYPRANYNMYVYSEEYKSPIKTEVQEPVNKIKQRSPSVAPSIPRPRVQAKEPAREASPPPAATVPNEGLDRFFNDDGNLSVLDGESPYFARTKQRPDFRGKNEAVSDWVWQSSSDMNQRPGPSITGKRNRADSKAPRARNEAEDEDVREPPRLRERAPKPPGTRVAPIVLNEGPDSPKEAIAGFSESMGSLGETMDQLRGALTTLGSALSANTAAIQRNSELVEKLAASLGKSRRKN